MALVTRTFSDIITFTRASTGTYFNSSGVLTSAAINAPRFDYNPSTLAAQGLLIEEQRANSLPRSEEFSDASWTKGGATVTADSTTAPSGTATADTLTEDTSTGQHRVYRSVSGTTNTNPYTYSIFAKAGTRTRIYIGIAEGTTFVRQGNAVFDLSAGTIVSASTGAGGATGGSATIQNVGNGWYRCTYTLTLGGTDTTIFNDINLVSSGTTISYTGNGTSGLFIWGAQLEAGAFPTSYIPTTTTALTRSADVAAVNTLNPWFNSTAGTLYAESLRNTTSAASTFPSYAEFDNGTTTRYGLYSTQTASTNEYRSFVIDSGVIQEDIGGVASRVAAGTIVKQAGAFTANDFALSVNGSSVFTDLAGTLPSSINRMSIGSSYIAANFANAWLRRITYYPRRLSNAELQAITA